MSKPPPVSPPKPVRIENRLFKFELPTAQPLKEANIYAFLDSGPSIPLQMNFVPEEFDLFVPRLEGWGKDSPYRVSMPVPKEIEHWHYELLTFPPEVFSPFVVDISILGERRD